MPRENLRSHLDLHADHVVLAEIARQQAEVNQELAELTDDLAPTSPALPAPKESR